MKKFVVLSCLLTSTSLYAVPNKVHDIEDVSVRSFHARLNQLVEEHGAENIVWVSDIHGVQTRDGQPSANAEPRGDMPNIVRTFVEQGGHFIAASADKNFMRVLDNLRQLGLLEAAGVKKMPKKAPELKTRKLPKHEDADSSFMTSTQDSMSMRTTYNPRASIEERSANIKRRAETKRKEQRKTEFQVVRTGRIVSVRKAQDRKEWFRAKYMAPEFARGHGELITKPVFIFTEDSGHNIKLFRDGMEGTNWYHLAQHVLTFQFESPEGDLYDADFIEPGQAPIMPAEVDVDSDDDSSTASGSDYETPKKTPEVKEETEYFNLDSSDDESGSEGGVSFASWPTKSLLETTADLGDSYFLSTGHIPIDSTLDSDDESSDDTPGNPLARSGWVPRGEVETVNLDDSEED